MYVRQLIRCLSSLKVFSFEGHPKGQTNQARKTTHYKDATDVEPHVTVV